LSFTYFAVPREPPVCCSLPSAVNQTLDVHCQAGQPYRYINADVHAIARFVSAPISFNQRAVDLALIEQACGGPHPTKCENCLAFRRQLEETRIYHAANAEEAHKKSLAACLEVPLTNCLTPAASTSATPIAPKLILIDFKKVQGKDRAKVFYPKIKATIKRLTPLVKLFNQFSDCVDISKFH
jgi:hypothetical protein